MKLDMGRISFFGQREGKRNSQRSYEVLNLRYNGGQKKQNKGGEIRRMRSCIDDTSH